MGNQMVRTISMWFEEVTMPGKQGNSFERKGRWWEGRERLGPVISKIISDLSVETNCKFYIPGTSKVEVLATHTSRFCLNQIAAISKLAQQNYKHWSLSLLCTVNYWEHSNRRRPLSHCCIDQLDCGQPVSLFTRSSGFWYLQAHSLCKRFQIFIPCG